MTSDAPPSVSIDNCGRFIVGQEPFFPIGLYSVPHQESFPELRRAGFNTVHSYELERTLYVNPQSRKRAIKQFDGLGDEAAGQYLDAAEDCGLRVLMGFNRPAGHEPDIFSDTGREQMRARVSALRQRPALLAWYVVDEPDGQKIPAEAVRDGRRIVESLDPNHPVSTVLCVPEKFEQYSDSASILMCDPYPVPREPLSVVGRDLAKLKEVAGPSRATVGVLQAFDWKSYDWTAEGARAPTLRELRCMTYQAIVSNVSGILYFNYHNEIHSNRSVDNPSGWAALSGVAGELRLLTPALLAPPDEPFPTSGTVGATFRTVGPETWILAVNPEPRPCMATFGLPRGAAGATVLDCFDAPARVETRDEFEVQFGPHGVRAMRVRLKE